MINKANTFFGYNEHGVSIDICLSIDGVYRNIETIKNIDSINKPKGIPTTIETSDWKKEDSSVVFVLNKECYFTLGLTSLKMLIKSMLTNIDFWFDFTDKYVGTLNNTINISVSRFNGSGTIDFVKEIVGEEPEKFKLVMNEDVRKYFNNVLYILKEEN